jgi:hypothetical protein
VFSVARSHRATSRYDYIEIDQFVKCRDQSITTRIFFLLYLYERLPFFSSFNYFQKNPSKPNFNHYLFETFGILIRSNGLKNQALIEKFEGNLFPIFNYALEQDVTGKSMQPWILEF